MLLKFEPIIESRGTKKAFVKLFATTCTDLNQKYKDQNAKNTAKISIESFSLEYLESLEECTIFKERCEKFFDTLDFYKHKQDIEKQYRARNDKICEHYRREKTSRIILNGKFDASRFTHLLQILKSANVFANNFRYQMIYVDNDRSIETKDLLSGATLYNSKNILLESGIKYNVSEYERLEVFTTAKTDNTENSRSANMLVSWKSDETTECINGHVNLQFSSLALPHITIDVNDYDNADTSIDHRITESLETTRDMIESLQVIKLENMTEEVKIYVVHQKPQMSQIGATMLIYDINKKDISESLTRILKTERRIECIKNVTIPMLENLVSYLDLYITFPGQKFLIPNICLINEDQIKYYVFYYHFLTYSAWLNTPNENLERLYIPSNCNTKSAVITLRKLVDYDCEHVYTIDNDIIKSASRKIGLSQASLYNILAKFKLSSDIGDCLDADTISYNRILETSEIRLYASSHQDGSITLQLWQKSHDFVKIGGIIPYLPKIYLNILANDSVQRILGMFKEFENVVCLERCYAYTLILKICKSLNCRTLFRQVDFIDEKWNTWSEKIHRDITQQLAEKISETESMEHQATKKATFLALQKSITVAELSTFFEPVL